MTHADIIEAVLHEGDSTPLEREIIAALRAEREYAATLQAQNAALVEAVKWASGYIDLIAKQRGLPFEAGEVEAYALATPEERATSPFPRVAIEGSKS